MGEGHKRQFPGERDKWAANVGEFSWRGDQGGAHAHRPEAALLPLRWVGFGFIYLHILLLFFKLKYS